MAPGNVLGHWSLGEAILSKKVQLRNQSKDVKEEGKKKFWENEESTKCCKMLSEEERQKIMSSK